MRSNITQEKLNDTSILTIESDVTAVLNFEKLIDSFACLKARKKLCDRLSCWMWVVGCRWQTYGISWRK